MNKQSNRYWTLWVIVALAAPYLLWTAAPGAAVVDTVEADDVA